MEHKKLKTVGHLIIRTCQCNVIPSIKTYLIGEILNGSKHFTKLAFRDRRLFEVNTKIK